MTENLIHYLKLAYSGNKELNEKIKKHIKLVKFKRLCSCWKSLTAYWGSGSVELEATGVEQVFKSVQTLSLEILIEKADFKMAYSYTS